MMFGKSLLKFPFLGFNTKTSMGITPKIAFAAALLKPSSLVLPSFLIDNIYRGVVALAVRPFDVGDKIKVDKYDGVVKSVSLWYLTLERGKGYVFIPTSHVYNTVIESLG